MTRPTTPAAPGALLDSRARRVELIISYLLRAGVVVSMTLIIIGTLVTFVRHPAYATSADELERLVAPGAAFPHTFSDLVSGLAELRGRALVTLGLLVLIGTPVMRVGVSILGFVYERDRLYTLITFVVFSLLLLSLVLGKAE